MNLINFFILYYNFLILKVKQLKYKKTQKIKKILNKKFNNNKIIKPKKKMDILTINQINEKFLYKESVGLEVFEFNKIFLNLKKKFPKIKKNKTFIFFYWLKSYTKYSNLSYLFNCSKATISRLIFKIAPMVYSIVQKIKIPESIPSINFFSFKIVGSIDATCLFRNRTRNQEEFYRYVF